MTAAGRPLRALAVVALAVPFWLLVRLPAIEQQFSAILAVKTAPTLRGQQPARTVPLATLSPAPPGAAQLLTPLAAVAGIASHRHATADAMADPIQPALAPAAIADRLPDGAAEPPPAAAAQATPIAEPPPPGFDLATRAYARLGAGDRRDADRLFAAALAAGPEAPQAGQWQRERRRLNRHWSGDAYTLWREAGPATAAAAPVLGGGQSGASLAYTPDPLARRPLAILGRLYAAHDAQGRIDGRSAQAAVGLRWLAAPGISLAAERLVPIGRAGRGDWNLRVAAGGERPLGRGTLDGYGEAGVRGNGDAYAGGQAHATLPIAALGPLRLAAGPGAWASVQSGDPAVARVDLGGGIVARLPVGLVARAEWRWRVAGNAAPGSGPALTMSWAF